MSDFLEILVVIAILVGGYFLVRNVIAPRFRSGSGSGSSGAGGRGDRNGSSKK